WQMAKPLTMPSKKPLRKWVRQTATSIASFFMLCSPKRSKRKTCSVNRNTVYHDSLSAGVTPHAWGAGKVRNFFVGERFWTTKASRREGCQNRQADGNWAWDAPPGSKRRN